ncbi:unnamed protein product [Rangifer tarandus platyrhynchus]|uniref:Uncharacterized protein n=2 Tax=Rangifer tarandus platyrhynchus TaxID=3082113 RepID=A0ABN8ZTE5_RANTA|nr:unnamed protein product [Rangifer tarandus platyrhynchus]CAI9709298.1 unnamed protein product [Rangifer tarandus platyrhynchus]
MRPPGPHTARARATFWGPVGPARREAEREPRAGRSAAAAGAHAREVSVGFLSRFPFLPFALFTFHTRGPALLARSWRLRVPTPGMSEPPAHRHLPSVRPSERLPSYLRICISCGLGHGLLAEWAPIHASIPSPSVTSSLRCTLLCFGSQ